MRRPVVIRAAAALAALVVLPGCGPDQERFADLDAFMADVRSRPAPPVPPLPEFQAYEPFAYSAAGQRSPFLPPAPPSSRRQDGSREEVQPDPDRPRAYLEQFSLTNLAMVGTIERAGRMYALVRDSSGGVHRVTAGDYLGQDHGRVVEVTETAIELDEIVPDGVGGWLRRDNSLQMAATE